MGNCSFEHFHPFPQCFPKAFLINMRKRVYMEERVNSSQNDKIFDVTKLKALADDTINVARMLISVFDRTENIVGKGENVVYQHSFPFPTMFSKGL